MIEGESIMSKPVAWTDAEELAELNSGSYANMFNGKHIDTHDGKWEALYSQEYVYGLLAELEEKDKRITTVTEEREFWRERVDGAEKEREEFRRRFKLERSCLEDADKRITALDMRNAELNSTIERWATDRAESASRIDELEAKLATPVQLPVSYSENPWMSPDPDGTWFDKGDVKESIRSAGFTVEGDE